MKDWQPQDYLAFADERTRAACDLLAQMPPTGADVVYDLGCGPGNSTALLVERYPQAQVFGVDNSPAMLAKARHDCPSAAYLEADIGAWTPDLRPAVLFSNATMQWVPDHLGVMKRLAACLGAGGVLAVQMPDTLMEPSHCLMQEVAKDGRWMVKLSTASFSRTEVSAPSEYYRHLTPLFSRVDIWQTVYHHVLDGVAGIVKWLSSTGLRPYIDPLDPDERAQFLAAYETLLADSYPVQPDGKVLLRFPRLFLVAVR